MPLNYQGVPLSPATSESSGPQSPTTAYSTYPVGMAPPMIPQESPTAPKLAADPNFFQGYYEPQFVSSGKSSGYWAGVSHGPHVSRYEY